MTLPRSPLSNPRHLALLALRAIHQGAYADIALDRLLLQWQGNDADRRLATELVYGTIRRQKTLDALIDQFSQKKQSHPHELRWILHIGLYQLRYLSQIPPSAAVNTTVELAKQHGLGGLAGFVNGLLRQYGRQAASGDPLILPTSPTARLALQHSFPEWMIEVWLTQWPLEEVEQLCQWFNQSPHMDLRVNPLASSVAEVQAAFAEHGIPLQTVQALPQALRSPTPIGTITRLPGFEAGTWSVQDGSSQLVSHVLAPQPGEWVVDACAAPGGKTTHMAELMGDRGQIWACDRDASRLKKLRQNVDRLGLTSIHIRAEDSLSLTLEGGVDRVLLDAPCSGLGTLHRHADARWRQTPERVEELTQLQRSLLNHCATWVKPGGTMVYSTCTLHPAENEQQVRQFLRHHPDWQLVPPQADAPWASFATADGWLQVLPHRADMDGFFIARLQRGDR